MAFDLFVQVLAAAGDRVRSTIPGRRSARDWRRSGPRRDGPLRRFPRPAGQRRTWASLASAAAKAASRWEVRAWISPSTSASRWLNRRQSTRPTCVRSPAGDPCAPCSAAPCRPGPARRGGGFPLRQRCPTIAAGSVPRSSRRRASSSELEAADAGGLFEDHAAVLGGGLQQNVNLALLDHAVGLRAQAAAGQQIADVAEPAGTAIDQILALAAAIDAPRDVDLRRIDVQKATGVVKLSVISAAFMPRRVGEPLKIRRPSPCRGDS